MIPFDGSALLVVLRTFYPQVTRANLERAFRERAEYFAGGRLFGSQGEKLLLLDGRAFDLAYDAWTPRSFWQVIEITDEPPSESDGYELEPGPIAPLDPALFDRPLPGTPFAELVAGGLAELGGVDGALGQAASTIAEHASPAGLAGAYDREIAPAAGTLAAEISSLESLNPAGLIGPSEGLRYATGEHLAEWPDEAPPEIPIDHPGRRPDDDEGDDDGDGRGRE